MNRIVAIVLTVALATAACGNGGPSLSEEAKNWCSRNMDLHGQVGIELGEAGQPGLTSDPFYADDFEFRSFDFYWTGDAGWNRVCAEAFERFGESG